MMRSSRSQAVSSFTIIKGTLLEETYTAFKSWDLRLNSTQNLKLIKDTNRTGAKSANWLRDVASVIRRRFDPAGRDRSLVELAQAGCDREIWKPLVLWHMTRDEFLVRDFLISWLFPRFTDGTYRLQSEDLVPYLIGLGKKETIAPVWSTTTLHRIATGLLRLTVDFGLMRGKTVKHFASFHLPDKSFLYLLHAIASVEQNPRKIVNSVEWRMFLMRPDDVEQELIRLHQYRVIEYEAAGSLARLKLPCSSPAEYARRLVA